MPADGALPAEDLVVFLNFTDDAATVWLPFPEAGTWNEQIDGTSPAVVVGTDGQWCPVTVPSNYGAIYQIA